MKLFHASLVLSNTFIENSRMKKIIIAVMIMVFATSVFSQTTISFCTYIDADGYCAFNNNKFITTPDSTTGKIFMKVGGTSGLGTKLVYKIFTVDKKGIEKLTMSLDQSIKQDWFFAWMPYIFPTNIKYKVQVFNDADKMICSKSFELIAGK